MLVTIVRNLKLEEQQKSFQYNGIYIYRSDLSFDRLFVWFIQFPAVTIFFFFPFHHAWSKCRFENSTPRSKCVWVRFFFMLICICWGKKSLFIQFQSIHKLLALTIDRIHFISFFSCGKKHFPFSFGFFFPQNHNLEMKILFTHRF